MQQTYTAILQNNTLHWTNAEPQNSGRAISVMVTIMEEVDSRVLSAKKEKLAQVMARMAARNSLSVIADPNAWQEEIRVDRNFPYRD